LKIADDVKAPEALERHFEPFRRRIVGIDQTFATPYGEQRIVYADWTASGRLYQPIERRMAERFGPFIGNTHSESSVTGTRMTQAYHEAHAILKHHMHASADDVILTVGSGMTGAIVKLQRILGLKVPEQLVDYVRLPDELRPVVFVTHMEHHSNHTSWLETIADVVTIEPDGEGRVDPESLHALLDRYRNRRLKIGAFTACSNVTGIHAPIHRLARIMHEHGGYCFADYAASAPYVDIDMHPAEAAEHLDAVVFSPHKFLGGPGASGVLVFNSNLYHLEVPDQPGGGTVDWTNPWGGRKYVEGIEEREDGGTPGFLQAIRAALAVRLKGQMGTGAMRRREEVLRRAAFAGLRAIPGVRILADHIEDRLCIFSFYVEGLHYNLIVKLLNDRFGIQARGGCSCAGTYGHYLLHVDPVQSKRITDRIDGGDLSEKPGWVRLSLHPTTGDDELAYIVDAVAQIVKQGDAWGAPYTYDSARNEFRHREADKAGVPEQWFDLSDEC
jgi:selenocysteine lyase/cysteine desulfurase